MYRFALRPAWIASHLLAAGLVVAFVTAGFWQLDRLDERRDRNAALEERSQIAAVPVEDLAGDPDDLRFRSTTATGTYLADAQVLVDNRTFEGRPGAWVVTPLDTGELVVAVNRGFVGVGPEGVVEAPAPPDGEVTVRGTVQPGAGRTCPARDGDGGSLLAVACADLDTIASRAGLGLAPFLVQLERAEPPAGDVPVPVPPPDLGEGPHLSYAVQWFIFAAIGTVGYPLILRRVARERAAEAAGAGDDAFERELRELLDAEQREREAEG